MNLCDLSEQELPAVCSYQAEITRKMVSDRKIDKILSHHFFDIDNALSDELRAWTVWETVNAGSNR